MSSGGKSVSADPPVTRTMVTCSVGSNSLACLTMRPSRSLRTFASEQLGDQRRRPRRAVRLDRPVVDLAPDLLGDRGGDLVGRRPSRSPCSGRPRSARAGGARGSSARSGGGAGSRGTAAGSRSAPSRSSARPGRRRGRRRRGGGRGRGRRPAPRARRAAAGSSGSIRGPATTIIRRSGTRSFASGKASMTRRSRCPPTPEPPTVTMQTRSSSP